MSSYQDFSDQDLLSLLKENDEAAFTEIYNRYSGVLYLHAYNKLRDREEAKDILHELFASIWNNRIRLELHSSLSGYLYNAVKNRIIKFVAKRQNQDKYINSIQESVNLNQSVTDHLIRQNQLREIIEKEIDALPPKMREVFLLSRKLHLNHKEIAEKLNISELTVKKQVNNALKILRIKLGLLSSLLFLL